MHNGKHASAINLFYDLLYHFAWILFQVRAAHEAVLFVNGAGQLALARPRQRPVHRNRSLGNQSCIKRHCRVHGFPGVLGAARTTRTYNSDGC